MCLTLLAEQENSSLLLFSFSFLSLYIYTRYILPLFLMDTVMQETSVARVYAHVNAQQPREYYDYEELQVTWG